MASLILLIIFGLGVSFFATQNTGSVNILLGSYMLDHIPLYLIVVGSLLLGVFISWLISVVNTLSTLFTIHGKDVALKHSEETIERLQAEKHDLEIKLASMEKTDSLPKENKSEKEETLHAPSFMQKLRQSLDIAPHALQ